MAMELKHLIEKLKKEGVEEADRQKNDIIEAAQEEAERIVKEAAEEAERLKKEAAEEAERIEKNAREAMRQSARDLLLSLRERVTALFEGVIKQKTSEALDTEKLGEIIRTVAEGYVSSGGGEVEVLLNEKDQDRLSEGMLEELKKKLSAGVEIKVDRKIKHGFKIGGKGEHSFYDFSEEAISEAFYNFLNPRIREMIKTEEEGEDE